MFCPVTVMSSVWHQTAVTTNNSGDSVVLHKPLGPVSLFSLGKVNERSLSLHNHEAPLQLSTVLFWCVSLFPTAPLSNQLRSISDFLFSLINRGWPRGPKGSEPWPLKRLTDRPSSVCPVVCGLYPIDPRLPSFLQFSPFLFIHPSHSLFNPVMCLFITSKTMSRQNHNWKKHFGSISVSVRIKNTINFLINRLKNRA